MCIGVFQILVSFLFKNGNPLWKKVTPFLPSNSPLKIESLSNSPFIENLVGASTPQQKGGGDAYYSTYLNKNEMQIKIHQMQIQLNSFHITFHFTFHMLYYYYLKRGTKWFGINNHDSPFSTTPLLHIGHITGGLVIWRMCNTPTLLNIGPKTEVILWCGWLPLAHLKFINFYICRRHARDMRRVMVLVQSTQHNCSFKAHLSNHLVHVCVWV